MLLLPLLTIVAAVMLDFCVRYGNRYFHHAIITRFLMSRTLKTECHISSLIHCVHLILRSSPRPISTGPLNMSPCLHFRPINLVVFKGSYFRRMGSLILEWASHLDAFSVYPFRTWLPSCAAGATTGALSVRPPWSSRTRGSSPQTSYAHDR